MRAIEDLRNDHDLIEAGQRCLDGLVREVRRTRELDVEAALRLLDFFELFEEGLHQEKEERGLFPVLQRRCSATRQVRQLAAAHVEEGREMSRMRRLVDGVARGGLWSATAFIGSAGQFLALQRIHLEWENAHLFPLALEHLDERDDVEILRRFGTITAAHGGLSAADFAGPLSALCRRFGALGPKAPVTQTAGCSAT